MGCNKGFSFVDFLLASSLGVTLVSVFVMFILSSQRSSLGRSDLTQLRLDLSTAFMDRKFCECNFKGIRFDKLNPGKVPLTQLDSYQADAAGCVRESPDVWIEKNRIIGRTSFVHPLVEDISLDNVNPVGSNRYLGNIFIELAPNDGANLSAKTLRIPAVPLVTQPVPGNPDQVEIVDCDFNPFDPTPILSDQYEVSQNVPDSPYTESFKTLAIGNYPEARRVVITNTCSARGPAAEVVTFVRFRRAGVFLGQKYYGCNIIGPEDSSQSIVTKSSFTALLPLGTDEIQLYIGIVSTSVNWGPVVVGPLRGQISVDVLK